MIVTALPYGSLGRGRHIRLYKYHNRVVAPNYSEQEGVLIHVFSVLCVDDNDNTSFMETSRQHHGRTDVSAKYHRIHPCRDMGMECPDREMMLCRLSEIKKGIVAFWRLVSSSDGTPFCVIPVPIGGAWCMRCICTTGMPVLHFGSLLQIRLYPVILRTLAIEISLE